ncbi:MAG: sensor histidine kinase [Vampirovibrionia bacterium]
MTSNKPNYYKNICTTVPVGFLVLNQDNDLLFINDQAKSLLRLKENYKNIIDLPLHLEYFKKRITELSPTDQKQEIFYNYKNKLQYFEIFSNYIHEDNEDRELKCITILDRTEDIKKIDIVKTMQDDLYQFKNLAAIGTMISGVAHELNNPISGISMSAQLAESALRELIKLAIKDNNDIPSEVVSEILETVSYSISEMEHVKLNTTRAAKLVGGLLNYSKKEKLDLELCNLKQLITETLNITRYQPMMDPSSIQINCDKNIKLNCDKLKIQQVIYNIVKNALESIEEKGLVKINCSLEDKFVNISIEDNGCGISSMNLNQLFTPFFTTKGPKKGTGLGLSISYRIIERHGGKITVNSELNKGSKFLITLPTNLE